MKAPLTILLLISLLLFSCNKESITESKEARLTLSTDTLRFDTVFTGTGAVTKYFLIKNENRETIRLSNLQLMGAGNTGFVMNVDGVPGSRFTNVEIRGNDSLYVFISVNASSNAQTLPFILRDSVAVEWNGNRLFKQLEAWGQNAHFLRGKIISNDTVWQNDLPYVILGGLIIDTNATLTLQPGVRLYFNADAPLIVDGTLQVNGTVSDSVVFQGNRLDEPYSDFPGSWPGIYFRGSSRNNQLNHAVIKNAYQGVVADRPAPNSNPKLVLNNCILDNIYDVGLLGVNTSIVANNCLISNCGTNVGITLGGNYQFTHCTIASFSNLYIQHKNPVFFASNFSRINNQVVTAPFNASLTNCIIWGDFGTVENEIVTSRQGNGTFNLSIVHTLFKAARDPDHSTFTNVLRNTSPAFDSINISRRIFNYRLKANSPALNKGIITSITTDLEGKPRVGLPDLGCYERQ